MKRELPVLLSSATLLSTFFLFSTGEYEPIKPKPTKPEPGLETIVKSVEEQLPTLSFSVDYEIIKRNLLNPPNYLEDSDIEGIVFKDDETNLVKTSRANFYIGDSINNIDQNLDEKKILLAMLEMPKQIKVETFLKLNILLSRMTGKPSHVPKDKIIEKFVKISRTFESRTYRDFLTLPEGYEFNHEYNSEDTDNIEQIFTKGLAFENYPKGSTIYISSNGEIENNRTQFSSTQTDTRTITETSLLKTLYKFMNYRAFQTGILPEGSYIDRWLNYKKKN